MRDLTKKAVLGSGILRLAAGLRRRGAAILMYHSVMDNPRRAEDSLGGIVHSTAVFRGQMELLARDYQPVSLDQVLHFVRREGELPQRAVVITFDDGYADNLEIAAPILNEVGIPATFYVTVSSVEQQRLPWPARLRFAFRSTKKRSWTHNSEEDYLLATEAERERAFFDACDLCCKLAGAAQEKFVSHIEEDFDVALLENSGALMMTVEQMRALQQQGHIVGSHTMTHPNMAQLNLADVHNELAESKRRLEQYLNAPVVHFSYPCPALSPHWTPNTVIESREVGYETAVTTDGGLASMGDDPLTLKRIRPTKKVEGLRWNLECAFAGRTV